MSLYNLDPFATNFCMLMAVMLGPEAPSFVRDLQWDVIGACSEREVAPGVLVVVFSRASLN